MKEEVRRKIRIVKAVEEKFKIEIPKDKLGVIYRLSFPKFKKRIEKIGGKIAFIQSTEGEDRKALEKKFMSRVFNEDLKVDDVIDYFHEKHQEPAYLRKKKVPIEEFLKGDEKIDIKIPEEVMNRILDYGEDRLGGYNQPKLYIEFKISPTHDRKLSKITSKEQDISKRTGTRTRNRPTLLERKVKCPICGKEFTKQYPNQRTCSKGCSQEAKRKYWRLRKKLEKEKQPRKEVD